MPLSCQAITTPESTTQSPSQSNHNAAFLGYVYLCYPLFQGLHLPWNPWLQGAKNVKPVVGGEI